MYIEQNKNKKIVTDTNRLLRERFLSEKGRYE
jgi:hypothetical protein